MSDELKHIYKGKGALDRYFDEKIPRDLYRGRKHGNRSDIMQPTILGFYKRKVNVRPPDILIKDQNQKSPQFVANDESKLVVDDEDGTLTTEIIRNGVFQDSCRLI